MYSVLSECFLPTPPLAQRAAGVPSMGWESRKHLFKIQKEIGRELSSTMFLETKRREAGPSGKSAVLQVCVGPGSRRACGLHRRGQ